MTAAEEKKRIRAEAKRRRSLADRREKDPKIAEQVFSLREYREAEWIFSYVSFRDEVDTRRIIERAWRDGKRVACPKIRGRDMEFYEVCSWEAFHPGTMGILEPKAGCGPVTAEGRRCLMLMPGLAFDRTLSRIGYGGGYYDRYLENCPVWTAALAYTEQIWDRIPAEIQDIRPDRIITEEGIIDGSDDDGTEGEKGGSQPECDGKYQKEQSLGSGGSSIV